MVPLRLELQTDRNVGRGAANPHDLPLLNHLRLVALGCRSKARTDLFKACALLHVDRAASGAACADVLMRCLPEALGKRAVMYRPGTPEVSFDEAWLLQLARASVERDEASISFLLMSRIGREHRRLVRFLMAEISENHALV